MDNYVLIGLMNHFNWFSNQMEIKRDMHWIDFLLGLNTGPYNIWHGQLSAHGKYTGMNEWMNEPILHCDTATEGCVSIDFFRHSLDDSPATYLT